jgi:redox-sensitive bicupin YhaK (pirin superfamily)
VIQLWVNLPAKDKMARPGYQALVSDTIPATDLPAEAGLVRVIAGRYRGTDGPARTFTPMNVWDIRLRQGKRAVFESPNGHTAALFVLKGRIRIGDGETVGPGELAVLERESADVELEAAENATVLFLEGEPIDEPVVGYGPFVMNTEEEIRQAVTDYQTGKMGRLTEPV